MKREKYPRITARRALGLLREIDVVKHAVSPPSPIAYVLRETADALADHVRAAIVRGERRGRK